MTNPDNNRPRLRRPDWIKVKRLDETTREIMSRQLGGLATVCASANCPNIGECWKRGTATFMIMGERCTRGCRFCNVETGRPDPLDPDEPALLARSISDLGLQYAVVTCVDRDDLEDSGAAHWAACIREVREQCPATRIEVLTGDFKGSETDIATVVRSAPEVFAHNVETVPRLQVSVRPAASWERSVDVLQSARRTARESGIPLLTKSGLMLGLGETDAEVREGMGLLREAGVDLLTLGQYLKPLNLPDKLEVRRYVSPEEFTALAEYGIQLGFKGVAASPLTRSSHLAETLYANATSRLAENPKEQC